MTRRIEVHMDTLTYSRGGLSSPTPIPLEVSQHNEISLIRPDRVRPVRTEGVGFAPGSAFPLPGTLATFWRAKQVRSPFTHHTKADKGWAGGVVQFYGHADETEGTPDKSLSERRARVGEALFAGDVEAFHELSAEDGWGDAQVQSMLRTVSCDPGPVDGEVGKLTLAALSTFADRYNRGVFHPRTETPASLLSADPPWGPDAIEAVRVAFVLAHGLARSTDQLHPHHPVHGCCGYNRASSEQPAANRRLSVLTQADVAEHSENAPCKSGDDTACAVVDEEPMRCMWYREHVAEAVPAVPRVADPRWLWIAEDRYVLSALTSADDGEPVVFEVFDAQTPGEEPPRDQLEGIVRGGVAAVVWASGQQPTVVDGRPPHQARPRFRVSHPAHPESRAEASWPDLETVELIQVCDDAAAVQGRSGGIRLSAQNGSYDHLVPFSSAESRSHRHVVLSFPNVPVSERVDMFVESGALRWAVLQGATLEDVGGNCEAGEQCQELPPAPGPPSYSLEDVEADWPPSEDEDDDGQPLEDYTFE